MREASLSLMAIEGATKSLSSPSIQKHTVVFEAKMQIGCAHIERIEEHLVKKPSREHLRFHWHPHRWLPGLLQSLTHQNRIRHWSALHRLGRGFGTCLYQAVEFVIFDDDPIHSHLSGEFDLSAFPGLWGRRCDNEAVAATC